MSHLFIPHGIKTALSGLQKYRSCDSIVNVLYTIVSIVVSIGMCKICTEKKILSVAVVISDCDVSLAL